MNISKLTLLHLFVFIVFVTLGTCQLAKGHAKWLGNVMSNYVPSGFSTYWNQVTLQWAGKWK
jgi:endo-1,4-beta-xylanase